jgi:two-component system sensor histidine kinase CreC
VEQQQRLEQAAPVELHALCAAVAGDCAGALAARAITLAMDGGVGVGAGADAGADSEGAVMRGAPLLVQGDELLLRQALGNLLDNAIGFAPRGSVIQLVAERRDGQAVIAVCDSGPGIPDYARERLFERFYSLPRPDGAKSTGLGLPFVREVAALHGGTVTVANAAHGGCCAELALPLPLAL